MNLFSAVISKFGISGIFGAAVAVGTAIQQPDWTMVAVVGGSVFWVNQRFNKIDRRIDTLPCAECREKGKNK
jgi:hypothetical protein